MRTSYDFSPLYRTAIGFDRLAQMFDNAQRADAQPSYPPYNIELVSEDKYRISMAVAGFSRAEIEIETETVVQVEEALAAGADIIMLDNMDCPTMRRCVDLIAGRALVEASGGVNLETVRAIAETGVDIISIGALTHSPRAMDISMLLDGA